ncbi:hypothetical protein, partial [Psittacicella gerlachiana]
KEKLLNIDIFKISILSLSLLSLDVIATNLIKLDKEKFTFSSNLNGSVYFNHDKYKSTGSDYTLTEVIKRRKYNLDLTSKVYLKDYKFSVGVNVGYLRINNELWEGQYYNKTKGLNRFNLFIDHPSYGNLLIGRFDLINEDYPMQVVKGIRFDKSPTDFGKWGKVTSAIGVGVARLQLDDPNTDFKTSFLSLGYMSENNNFTLEVMGFIGKFDEKKMYSWKYLPETAEPSLEGIYVSGVPRISGLSAENNIKYKNFNFNLNVQAYKLENIPFILYRGVYYHNDTVPLIDRVDNTYIYSQDITFTYNASLTYKFTRYFDLGINYIHEKYKSSSPGNLHEVTRKYNTVALFAKLYPFVDYYSFLKDSYFKIEIGKTRHNIVFKDEDADVFSEKDNFNSIFLTYELKF